MYLALGGFSWLWILASFVVAIPALVVVYWKSLRVFFHRKGKDKAPKEGT